MKNRQIYLSVFYIYNKCACNRKTHVLVSATKKHEHVKCLCITENRLKREEK